MSKSLEQLKLDIELAMNVVEDYQKLYRNQTGQDFVKPLRLRRLEEKRVLIDPDLLEELECSDAFLDKLYAAGVDSWEGFEIAQDMEN